MQEYLENGLCLGGLLNPRQHTVEVYRPGQTPERIINPAILTGDAVLSGFELNLTTRSQSSL